MADRALAHLDEHYPDHADLMRAVRTDALTGWLKENWPILSTIFLIMLVLTSLVFVSSRNSDPNSLIMRLCQTGSQISLQFNLHSLLHSIRSTIHLSLDDKLLDHAPLSDKLHFISIYQKSPSVTATQAFLVLQNKHYSQSLPNEHDRVCLSPPNKHHGASPSQEP